MRLPLKRLKAFIAVFLLLALPLVGSVSANATVAEPTLAVFKSGSSLDADVEAGDLDWDQISSLGFEFGNWIPEAIRSVTVRITNLAPTFGGLDIFFNFIPVRVVFPLHQPDNFSVKPDFVGFLFRLKPF